MAAALICSVFRDGIICMHCNSVKRRLPITLVAAQILIAFLIVHLAIALVLDVRLIMAGGSIVRFLFYVVNLGWTVGAFLGIQFRWRIMWSIARTASALLVLLAVFSVLVAALLLVVGGKHHVFFLWSCLWFVFCAAYFFLLCCLLWSPSAAAYFGEMGNGEMGNAL